MTSNKYLKLVFNKRIRENSVKVTEYFTPYTYAALTNNQENKEEEASILEERNNYQDGNQEVLIKILESFNIGPHNEVNKIDCYYDEPIDENAWKNNPDNLSYVSIFDYWSEAHIVSEMANMESSHDQILDIVTQELRSKVFISELKKNLSILLRFDKDSNAWNSSHSKSSAHFDLRKVISHLINTIKHFFAKSEQKSGEQLSSIINDFLIDLESKRFLSLTFVVIKIKKVCETSGLYPFQIKLKIINLLKKHLDIDFNEKAFKTRQKFLLKLKRDYNLTKYSNEEFREFAYFPEKLLANLTRIIVDLQDHFYDFKNLQRYFNAIDERVLGSYYGNGKNSNGCFAIMKKDTKGYFALSGVYDYPNNTDRIETDEYWQSYITMKGLADEINLKIFKSEYVWCDLIDDVLTYYSHENLVLSKLKNAKLLDKPVKLIDFIDNSPNEWLDVISKPTYRLFSCCEKKLLAQLNDETYSSLDFYIRYRPCHLCMPPMFEIVNKGKSMVYSLADSFKELKSSKDLKEITSDINDYNEKYNMILKMETFIKISH